MTTQKNTEKEIEEFKGNLLGGFIAESKTDEQERLWVRIDNYLGNKIGGKIVINDEEKMIKALLVLISKTRQSTLNEVVEKIEEIIQKERFAGAPYALNEVIRAVKSLQQENKTELKVAEE